VSFNLNSCLTLCFLKCKFGRIPLKTIHSALSDFYSGEQLSAAKQQLLDDISEMNSSIKLPHMPRRRDGDNKVIKETDDIISLFTFIDENKLQDVAKIRF